MTEVYETCMNCNHQSLVAPPEWRDPLLRCPRCNESMYPAEAASFYWRVWGIKTEGYDPVWFYMKAQQDEYDRTPTNLYLLDTVLNGLYIGISKHPEKRIWEHHQNGKPLAFLMIDMGEFPNIYKIEQSSIEFLRASGFKLCNK